MGGRWTWEGGDAVWMGGGQEGGRRGERGGETVEQRNIEVNHSLIDIHPVHVCVLGLTTTRQCSTSNLPLSYTGYLGEMKEDDVSQNV